MEKLLKLVQWGRERWPCEAMGPAGLCGPSPPDWRVGRYAAETVLAASGGLCVRAEPLCQPFAAGRVARGGWKRGARGGPIFCLLQLWKWG